MILEDREILETRPVGLFPWCAEKLRLGANTSDI